MLAIIAKDFGTRYDAIADLFLGLQYGDCITQPYGGFWRALLAVYNNDTHWIIRHGCQSWPLPVYSTVIVNPTRLGGLTGSEKYYPYVNRSENVWAAGSEGGDEVHLCLILPRACD